MSIIFSDLVYSSSLEEDDHLMAECNKLKLLAIHLLELKLSKNDLKNIIEDAYKEYCIKDIIE
jgi:hypothetical protein